MLAANEPGGVENWSGYDCCLEAHTLIYEPKIGFNVSTFNVFSVCARACDSLSARLLNAVTFTVCFSPSYQAEWFRLAIRHWPRSEQACTLRLVVINLF